MLLTVFIRVAFWKSLQAADVPEKFPQRNVIVTGGKVIGEGFTAVWSAASDENHVIIKIRQSIIRCSPQCAETPIFRHGFDRSCLKGKFHSSWSCYFYWFCYKIADQIDFAVLSDEFLHRNTGGVDVSFVIFAADSQSAAFCTKPYIIYIVCLQVPPRGFGTVPYPSVSGRYCSSIIETQTISTSMEQISITFIKRNYQLERIKLSGERVQSKCILHQSIVIPGTNGCGIHCSCVP